MHTQTHKHVHTHGETLLSHKKILPFTKIWVKLKDIMLTKISQTEKDKYYIASFICGI